MVDHPPGRGVADATGEDRYRLGTRVAGPLVVAATLADCAHERADRAARDMVHHSKSYIMRVLAKGVMMPLPDELPARMESVGTR